MLELPPSECTEIVFRSVVQLCEPRIIGRLKCKDWIPPAYHTKRRRPMHEDLEQVFNWYLSKPKEFTDQMKSQTSRLRDFINFMIRVHRHNSTVTFQNRLEALQLAGSVCDIRQSLELALEQIAIKVDDIRMKAIRAFDKVANYRHISERLSRLAGSRKFRRLFQSLRFRFLDNYAPHMVLGRERFVHAEVRIVTFHRLESTRSLPMAIGTTKAACYLCNLFLSLHPQYTISATHGTLFDAWTIPDVLSYSVKDRRELRAVVQNMQTALEARARQGNHGFRPFPVQSGIYYVPSLPSLAGTVIAHAALVETASISTVRSISETHSAVATPSMESVGEAVFFSESDRDAVSPLAAVSQRPCGHRAAAKYQYSKEKESRLQQRAELLHVSETSVQVDCKVVVESDPGCQLHTKAESKAGTEDREVSEREGAFNRRNGGECKPPEISCPSSARIERPDWRRQKDEKEIEISPHRDTGSGRTIIAYRSSDHAGRLSSATEPTQTELNAGREPFGEIEQRTGEFSNGQSRKGRRRRRRKVKRHPDLRKNNDASRQLRDKTYPGHRSRLHTGHAGRKKSYYRSPIGRHSFLQSLWRAIRGAHRLFCV